MTTHRLMITSALDDNNKIIPDFAVIIDFDDSIYSYPFSVIVLHATVVETDRNGLPLGIEDMTSVVYKSFTDLGLAMSYKDKMISRISLSKKLPGAFQTKGLYQWFEDTKD